MKILFIIDDESVVLDYVDKRFNKQFEIVWETRVDRAFNFFIKNRKDIFIIILDCCIESDNPDTIDLANKIIKSGFPINNIISKSTGRTYCYVHKALGIYRLISDHGVVREIEKIIAQKNFKNHNDHP